ncbi:hypothetical protein ADINL_3062 [Nitrincola lacisaponensis]|uniref:Uncharacterized protein n=1 Tax=Nitrincola lacisaponensis TaxID=267850 RepID=A0A063Y267_9GAMM|nr:hypothetical protein ADINL_3062 [Nitrincola lacisaponensis]
MTYTEIAGKPFHMTGPENLVHQTIILAHKEAIAFARYNTGSILSAMLKHRQGIKKGLINVASGKNAHYTAHAFNL